jgi:hypothetical protein
MVYLRVLMIRGVSQATQAPVSRPNRRRLVYLRVLMIRGVSQAPVSRPNRSRLAYLRVLMIREAHRPPRPLLAGQTGVGWPT